MNRSGYSDDAEGWMLNLYGGIVAAILHGATGQRFLRELLTSLEALPSRSLIAETLIDEAGRVCALGAVARQRNLDVQGVDPDDADAIAALFGIPHQLAREIMDENDNCQWIETPDARWRRMKQWATRNIERSY